jgi:hypothetical protein
MKQIYFNFERKSFLTLLLGLSLLVGTQGIKAATITSTAIGGDWNSTSTWEGGVVPANSTADYVIILGTATVTLNLTANFTVGALDINEGGALNVSQDATPRGFTLGTKAPGSTIAGALFFDSTVTGTKSFGTVTVTATGSVIETILKSISMNNGANGILTNYGTITTGTLAMSGTGGNLMNMFNYGTINSTGFSSQTVGTFTNYEGAVFNFNGAIGGNVKNYGTINSSNLSGSSAVAKITNYSTGVINFTGGSMSSTTLVLDATETGNKVNYIAAVSQTIKDVVYSNLILANGGTKTIPTAASGTLCTGTLTISDAAKASITNTDVVVGVLNLGGLTQLANTYGGASSTATIKNSTYLTGFGSFNVQNVLGVDQFTANEVKLYPNPSTTGNFTISLPFMQEPSKVSILNGAGQTLYNNTIPAGETAVIRPNTTLSSGIYFLKMEQSGKSITKKLIIN